jgi:hypothetical protein
MTEYLFHPVATIFPLQDEMINYIAHDIKDRVAAGLPPLIVPIWLYEGKIIDGRQRYLACKKAGVEPTFQTWDGHGSLIKHVISLGLLHRHLSIGEKAIVAAKALPLLREEAQARQRAGKKIADDLSDCSRQGNPCRAKGKASEQAAALVGVSSRSVERTDKVMRKGSQELREALEKGEVSLAQGASIADLSAEEQVERLNRSREEAIAAQARDKRNAPLDSLDKTVRLQQEQLQKFVRRLRRRTRQLEGKAGRSALTLATSIEKQCRQLDRDLARVRALVQKERGAEK